MAEKNLPVHKMRSGAISVSIWKHDSENGAFHTATPQRAYTRDNGESWEYTDSFSRDDLPTVALLMQSAWAWINRREQEEKK
jgi:hypothetical protein